MELVEGPTLAERIKEGAIPLDESLAIARQIADALEAAHEKGIVHRDLKPGNVIVKEDGSVKVLDFGLAKVAPSSKSASDGDNPELSPTISMAATQAGVILGTAAYMAPEQARGKPVDKRADIWAFGVVLYEMVTGQKLFKGEDLTEMLAAVVNEKPNLGEAPLRVRTLITKCVEKKPGERLRDIGDWNLLLEEDRIAAVSQATQSGGWWKWVSAATSICLVAALYSLWIYTRPVELPVLRFDVEVGTDPADQDHVAISPDGSRIAFAGRDENGKGFLQTRRLDQDDATTLDDSLDSIGTSFPFFSPDGRWIGYAADHQLKKVSVEGGVPVTVAQGRVSSGASSWGDNGEIVSQLTFTASSLIPADGGAPRSFTSRSGRTAHLPGQEVVLLSNGSLFVVPLDGGEEKEIPGIRSQYAKYLPNGYILFLDLDSVLQAVPFDPQRLEATGRPFPLLENVVDFDVSMTGTLLYRRGEPQSRTLHWVDESGVTEPIIPKPGEYATPRLSPDGKRLALAIRDDQGQNQLWVRDMEGGGMTRLTFGEVGGAYPLWMPGGNDLVLQGREGMYQISADGSGQPRLILETDGAPTSISPDGRTLAIVRRDQDTQRDIWTVPLQGEGETLQAGEPEPLINGPADEITAAFSPNGKWLAYSSTETGPFNIYVRSLKNPGATWQLTVEDSYLPEWTRPGELIVRSVSENSFWVVSYSERGDTFVPGAVRPYGGSLPFAFTGAAPTFTFAPPGDRMAVLLVASPEERLQRRTNYGLILNFFEEIERHAAQTGAR